MVFNLFPFEKGMKVLDVGCGTGNQSIKLAKMGVYVTGIDVSEKMLQVARQNARNEGSLPIEFLLMDAENLEFEDNTFDGAISVTAFEFLPDPVKVLQEMLRVVKKGGSVAVGTINRDSSWGEKYTSEKYKVGSVFKHANLKTEEDLRKWYPDRLEAIGKCLFIPPDAEDNKISLENEKILSETEKGGFLCALWKK